MAESKRIELTVAVSLDMDALMAGVKEAVEKAVSVSGISAEHVTESPDAVTTIPVVRIAPLYGQEFKQRLAEELRAGGVLHQAMRG